MNKEAMPPSPFLPGTRVQYAFDSTSLGYLKTCPRLYYYTMIEGWVPKDDNIHLRFGQEYHQAIQDFDTFRAAGEGFEDAVRETVRQLLIRIHDWDPDTGTKAGHYKNPTTLLGLVVDYLDKYKDDPLETFILEDGRPAVELSFRFALDFGPANGQTPCPKCGGSGFTGPHNYDGVCSECGGQKFDGPPQPYLLCGHLDRVVTKDNDRFVIDHKTTTTTPSQYFFAGFNPNNQMTLYSYAGEVVLNTPIAGVIVEAAQIKLVEPNEFVRGMTYRTADGLDEWLFDLEYWLNAAEAFAVAGHWPMNDTSCDKFGGCRFRDICNKSPAVRERFLETDFIKQPEEERWNPLRSR